MSNNDLITVEDYNSAMINFKQPFFYIINTNDFEVDTEYIIDNFIKITINDDNTSYDYDIEALSDIWGGQLMFKTQEGAIIPLSYGTDYPKNLGKAIVMLLIDGSPFSEKTPIHSLIKFTDKEYMGYRKRLVFEIEEGYTPDDPDDVFLKLKKPDRTIMHINRPTLNDNKIIFEIEEDKEWAEEILLSIRTPYGMDKYSFIQKQFKAPPYIKLMNEEGESEALVGMINPMEIGLLFEATSENPVKIEYSLDNVTETITVTDNTTVLDLDLRNRIDLKEIKLTGIIGRGDENYEKEFSTKILPKYVQATNENFDSLISNPTGVKVFEISEDLTLSGTYYINHNTKIIGNEHSIQGNNDYNFIIGENVKVEISDLNFENADSCFIQNLNSDLTLIDCSFTDCTASNFEGLGSVVHCDTDIGSLAAPDDFITTVKNSRFTNCYGAISHGGQIIVDSCNIIIDAVTNFNNDSPYFIFQIDGECSIRNSKFDMTIDNDALCSNQVNAKIGQCLFLIGNDAILNGKDSNDLNNENNLNFFGGDYNNSSHIFIKYYYPHIENCVYVSPLPNREDKTLCYALNGIDYIYKYNAQITRADWGTENRLNPFGAGD